MTLRAEKKHFLWKAALVSVVTASVVLGSMHWYGINHRLIYAIQKDACLPNWNFGWVDFREKSPQRGDVFAFKAKGIKVKLSNGKDYFADGTAMFKVVAGIPGDVVDVGVDTTRVNGEVVGNGLALLRTIKKVPEQVVRHVVVPSGHYFFMGKTYNSYDGRYWGFVAAEQIIGKCHRIF